MPDKHQELTLLSAICSATRIQCNTQSWKIDFFVDKKYYFKLSLIYLIVQLIVQIYFWPLQNITLSSLVGLKIIILSLSFGYLQNIQLGN